MLQISTLVEEQGWRSTVEALRIRIGVVDDKFVGLFCTEGKCQKEFQEYQYLKHQIKDEIK